eukprot:m.28215 g.28215  ORF g.28215 m.28215 type:complete len:584 (-) comp15886_c0_seq1:149-1900(-)
MADLALYHDINKRGAEALIADGPDGTHLLRSKSSHEFILTLKYKGNPTHHNITEEGGKYLINGKGYGDHSSIAELLDTLSQDGVQKWPVKLVNPINASTAASAESKYPWHPAADLEFTEATLDGKDNGSFLIRPKSLSDVGPEDRKVLSVVFRGAPTHHHLVFAAPNWTLNNDTFGAHTTIDSLVAALNVPVAKKWPVGLTNPVFAGAEPESPPPSSTPPAVVSTESEYQTPQLAKADTAVFPIVSQPDEQYDTVERDQPPPEPTTTEPDPPVTAAVSPTPISNKLSHVYQNEPEPQAKASADPIQVKAPTITPVVNSQPAAAKSQKAKVTRAEKLALMEAEEAARDARIKEAIARSKNPHHSSDTNDDDKDRKPKNEFVLLRKQQQKERELAEAEEARQRELNANSWKSKIAQRKKSKEEEAPTPAPPKMTKVELRLKQEREAAEEEVRQRAAIAQKLKDDEKIAREKKEKSKALADKMAAERKKLEEDMLSELPQWKQDKIRREQAKEADHQKHVATEREKRLKEMRQQREKEDEDRQSARERLEKESIEKARQERLQKEAEVEAAIEEVRRAQKKLALKS